MAFGFIIIIIIIIIILFFLQDLDYEGALRFYFDNGKSELTKAVRITNRTTTEELIPKLVEKFSLPTHDDEQYALFEVHEQQEEEGKKLYKLKTIFTGADSDYRNVRTCEP